MTILFISVTIMIIACCLLLGKRKNSIDKSSNTVRDYAKILNREVLFYQNLDTVGKSRFMRLVIAFLEETRIEGVGTEITDLDRMLIASSAVIPIFGFPDWKYKNLSNIVLYPDTFNTDFQFEGESRNILGMVGSGFMNGQMLLSRLALLRGFSTTSGKENTAIHEFVHLLDKSDGATDGIPENLLPHQYATPWLKMMHKEMNAIEAGHSDINPYAITNEAEFLAVTTEYFFEKPEKFQKMHPELYEMLSRIFAQSPG
ncbi:MAG: zinc-dependent peptidase [Pedobacter sp.]|nr:zinc-dependent peptidase [Pedobacter sp.]